MPNTDYGTEEEWDEIDNIFEMDYYNNIDDEETNDEEKD